MTAKTRHCDECKHFTRYETRHPTVCKLGHQPMFRKPKNEDPHDSSWGWKRRCEDFKELGDDARSKS